MGVTKKIKAMKKKNKKKSHFTNAFGLFCIMTCMCLLLSVLVLTNSQFQNELCVKGCILKPLSNPSLVDPYKGPESSTCEIKGSRSEIKRPLCDPQMGVKEGCMMYL